MDLAGAETSTSWHGSLAPNVAVLRGAVQQDLPSTTDIVSNICKTQSKGHAYYIRLLRSPARKVLCVHSAQSFVEAQDRKVEFQLPEVPVDEAKDFDLLRAAQAGERLVSSGQNVELDLSAPHATLGEFCVPLVVDATEEQDARNFSQNAFVIDGIFLCSKDRLR